MKTKKIDRSEKEEEEEHLTFLGAIHFSTWLKAYEADFFTTPTYSRVINEMQ
jgi:hypothetical protein